MKARFGPWYYAQAALATFLEKYVVNAPRLIATAGDREMRGVSVFVQNTQPYTYFRRTPINLSDASTLESGDLSGAVLSRANALDVPTIAYRLLSQARADRQPPPRASVRRRRRAARAPRDDRLVPVQVDGDFVGEHEEAVFSVLRGGLQIVR